MTIYFSPAPKPISPPKAPKLAVNKENKPRKAQEFKRTYHSRARQKFVNLLECSACGVWGYSQNAHVLGNDGASRKGPYTSVAPLCGPRPDGKDIFEGCHSLFDTKPEQFRARYPSYNPKLATRSTEKKWREFCASAQRNTR